MKQNQLVITIILVLFVGGLAFFGGMKYQESKSPSFGKMGTFNGGMNRLNGGMTPGQNAGSQQSGSRQRMGAVSGEVIASDNTSITVKLPDGSSKIVLVGEKTAINKASEGSKSDLSTGTTVAVFGQTNTDGSVTAENIQINPMMPNTPEKKATP